MTRAPVALATLPYLAAAVLALAACGDDGGPTEGQRRTVTLRLNGTRAMPGEIRNVGSDASRLALHCRATVTPQVDGPLAVRLLGASVTIQHQIGGDRPPPEVTSFPDTHVASWFGTPTLQPGKEPAVVLESWVVFPTGREPFGAVGAHEARWAIAYDGGRGADSAIHTLRCEPARGAIRLRLTDPRTNRGVANASLTIGGVTATTDSFGWGTVGPVVQGRHPLTVRSTRHAPVDTVVLVEDFSAAGMFLQRQASDIDRMWFDCDPVRGCELVLDWYDAAGASAMPDTLSVSADYIGPTGPTRHAVAARSVETLDAVRRRYRYGPPATTATTIGFIMTNTLGWTAKALCTPNGSGSFNCNEF